MKDKTLITLLAIIMTLGFATMVVKYKSLEEKNEELIHQIIKLESVVDYLENTNNDI